MDDEFDVSGQAVPGAVYRILLQVALLGTEIGEIAHATEIAETLQELRPDLPHASVVLAMNDFYAGKKDDGIRALESTLGRFPDSQLSKAMLAVCLQNVGRSGWQQMLESVIEDGRDEYAIGLACAILGRSNDSGKAAVDSSGAPFAPAHALWA